jgi:23S rRNA (uracil1939-C5)-methyltransferase
VSPSQVDVTLNALTYGGEALGRLEDGRAVFVPFGLPGEQVRIQVDEDRERYARGRLIEVLRPSAVRQTPRCKHFKTCGGCHYQHLAYERQLAAKASILRDQLSRIGRIEDPPVEPTVASSNAWNYRNHAKFHLTPAGRLGYMGVREAGIGRAGVVGIEECHLPEESINDFWPQVELQPGSEVERASLRAGTDGDLMLVLESSTPATPGLEIEAGISVAHLYEGDCVMLAGDPCTTITILGRDFQVSADSFFQVNAAIAECMVRDVLGTAPTAMSTAIDAYCGVGLFSAFLAPRCARLISIESSTAACADFAANLDEFENVELYEGLAERTLPALDVTPDIVLVDPPRAGVGKAALDAIVRMAPEKILYVSCDPATLARDARRLIRSGYGLARVTPFDMFPQTYHIESISVFER